MLIIGQTPPPLGGQALMIQALLDNPMPGVERHHVRLAYSNDLNQTGGVSLRKIGHLIAVIGRVLLKIAGRRPHIVYYPPGGPNLAPALRDMITLLAIRPFCRRLVLHYHAAGTSEVGRTLRPAILARLFVRAFRGADAAIMLSRANPPDGQALAAKRVYFVPNGIPDVAGGHPSRREDGPEPPRVLFVGVVTEAKGALILAEACAQLWRQGLDFELQFMGSATEGMRALIREAVGPSWHRVSMLGVRAGHDKWRIFANASMLCFPTHFEAETFGLVCLEAMMFGLPVVATAWRGVVDVVVDGETGYLVEPQSSPQLARALHRLLTSPELRRRMGDAGRSRFEREFTIDLFMHRMTTIFREVAT